MDPAAWIQDATETKTLLQDALQRVDALDTSYEKAREAAFGSNTQKEEIDRLYTEIQRLRSPDKIFLGGRRKAKKVRRTRRKH